MDLQDLIDSLPILEDGQLDNLGARIQAEIQSRQIEGDQGGHIPKEP